MRIQHNIAAMNAYRNYNINTSAVSKNLEKLSSGYKINRAGDDAAGLAISEKMRAQITGLDAATKNVKDGISLVKTAEGAMQEVQDMLNRMVSLATQSANGTYDNEVDRDNLQKEVDQLQSEINRIADSANFNGIKLLDGSLDAGVDTVSLSGATNAIDTVINDGQLAGKTPTAGKYSVDFSQATITASELGEGTAIFKLAEDQGAIATLKIGKGESLSGADLAEAIKEGLEKSNAFKNGALEMMDAEGNKTKFNLSVDGSKLVLEMTEPPKVAFDTKLDAAFEAVDGTVTLSVTGEQIQVTPEVEAVPEVGRAYGQASFTLTADKIKDGAAVKIGNETYIFCVGENSKYKGLKNAIDMTDAEGDVALAAQRLAQAAKDNESFYVGANLNDGVVTVTEKEGAVDYSKNNLAGTDGKSEVNGSGGDQDADLDDWAGLVEFGTARITNTAKGTALTLQIGDTSDSYNQLKVSIGDIHTKALGIDKISIATQAGAAAAVNTIKTAINNVSSIRGTLGATQNRLEHTQNNLSVMKENIQDAESTIRDTDIAEEMMSYTKNNILVQSAQAMLAQANQIPQGVLQLLG